MPLTPNWLFLNSTPALNCIFWASKISWMALSTYYKRTSRCITYYAYKIYKNFQTIVKKKPECNSFISSTNGFRKSKFFGLLWPKNTATTKMKFWLRVLHLTNMGHSWLEELLAIGKPSILAHKSILRLIIFKFGSFERNTTNVFFYHAGLHMW